MNPAGMLLGMHLWRLFEHSGATIWPTSNLAPAYKPPPQVDGAPTDPVPRTLMTHPDVSSKVVMRLCGERVDAAMMQLAQAKADIEERQLTREEWSACARPAMILKYSGNNQRFTSSMHQRSVNKRAAAQKVIAP